MAIQGSGTMDKSHGNMGSKVLKFSPFALSLAAAVLIILVLTAGSSPGALPPLYLLKVDTSALSVAPMLSTSQYLVDLSALTSTDLTGPPRTPSILGISPLYHVYVFTCCSLTRCTAPLVGPSFDPMHNLRLSLTSASAPSASLSEVLSLYRAISPLLSILLILSFVLVLAGPSVKLLERRIHSAAWVAVLMSVLAALCLVVACAASQVAIGRFADGLNRDLGPVGLSACRGPLLYPAWAAVPVCFVNTVLMFATVRSGRGAGPDEKGMSGGRGGEEGAGSATLQEREQQQQQEQKTQEPETQQQAGEQEKQQQPWHNRPLAVAEGSRIALTDTIHERLEDGWLRKSVLGSVDGGSAVFAGDGSSGSRPSGGGSGHVVRRP